MFIVEHISVKGVYRLVQKGFVSWTAMGMQGLDSDYTKPLNTPWHCLQADKMQTMCHGDPKGANIMYDSSEFA